MLRALFRSPELALPFSPPSGTGDPLGEGFHGSDPESFWLWSESLKGMLLRLRTSTLSARAVFGVKAPNSQSLTRLNTEQKLGLGDFDLALGWALLGLLVRLVLTRSLVEGESLLGTARFSDIPPVVLW